MKDLINRLLGGARRADARQQGVPGHAAVTRRSISWTSMSGATRTRGSAPRGTMTEEQIAEWTAAIDKSH